MWLAIVIALIGGIGSIGAVLQSRSAVKRAQEMTLQKVDADAYKRAQEIYEGGIADMHLQLTQLRVDLADQRAENTKLRLRVSELETQVVTMKLDLKD